MIDSSETVLELNIEKFFTFFNALKPNGNINKFDCSFLYLNSMNYLIIDTLSKAVFPRIESNSERVKKFIKQFGNWPDGERLSLPHISRLIEIIPNSFSVELKKLVESELTKYRVQYYIKNDPLVSEIEHLWPKTLPAEQKKFEKITKFQHYSFFYNFRNDLIHELKMSGQGFNKESTDPYYYLACTGPTFSSKKYYRLFYPPLFLSNLVSNCLGSTKLYFKENKINPYDSFDFGIFNFKEFNNYT